MCIMNRMNRFIQECVYYLLSVSKEIKSAYLALQMQVVVQEFPHLFICVFLRVKETKIWRTFIIL